MIAIRTVVCPVDFSPATVRQVALAVDLCRSFGAHLVLHHNVTDVSIGAGVGWMWHADHEPATRSSVDEAMRAAAGRVPNDVSSETCITRGGVTESVLAVSDAADADVVIMSAHTRTSADHTSAIEHLLECSSRAVLALHDPGEDVLMPKFVLVDGDDALLQSLLVPVNMATAAHAQLEFACDLARVFPFRLHLLHVIEGRPGKRGPTGDATAVVPRLDSLVPDDLRGRAAIHVRTGDTVPVIVRAARELSTSCIVMGEHTRVPVKRWLSHDTARAVLREAPCPVWYVPAPRAAVKPLSRFALSNEKSIIWGNV